MCFSAQASFSAAITMSLVGLYSLSQAKSKNLRLFAAIPLLFACQQALEGIVWLTFNENGLRDFVHQAAIFGYLFFASMLWPVWVPASLYVLEKEATRKKIIKGILSIGVGFSLIYAVNWAVMGMPAQVEDRHIVYPFLFNPFATLNIKFLTLLHYGLWVAYSLCTIVVFFCSSVRWMIPIGIYIAAAFIISAILSQSAVGSIWCFFAAFFSFIICFMVLQDKKNTDPSSILETP